MNAKRLFGAICITLAMSILPLPEWLSVIRPAWVLLLVLYIQYYSPKQFHLSLVVFLGLCLDVLMASIIGEHIFSLVLSAWIGSIFFRRFHFFLASQQIFIIFILTLTYQASLSAMDAFLGDSFFLMSLLGVPLLSCLVWPWVCILLNNNTQHGYR